MFGDALERAISYSQVSKTQLCRIVGISRPYLYSIIAGDSRPPSFTVLIRIADELELTDDDRWKLYDLAAEERGEVPADIFAYFMDSQHVYDFRRAQVQSEDGLR